MVARVNASKSTPVQQIKLNNSTTIKKTATERTMAAVSDLFSFNLNGNSSVDRWTLLIAAKFFEKAWDEPSYSVKLVCFIIGIYHAKLLADRQDARSKIHYLEQKAKSK